MLRVEKCVVDIKGYHKTLILGTFFTVSDLIILENWKHFKPYLHTLSAWFYRRVGYKTREDYRTTC